MWYSKVLKRYFIGIVVRSHTIEYSLLEKKDGSVQLITRQETNSHNYEWLSGAPINIYVIKEQIEQLTTRYNVKHVHAIIGLEKSDDLFEAVVSVQHPHDLAQHPIVQSIVDQAWNAYEIGYNTHDGLYYFYTFSIPHKLLIRYRLMCHVARITCLKITTIACMLLESSCSMHKNISTAQRLKWFDSLLELNTINAHNTIFFHEVEHASSL